MENRLDGCLYMALAVVAIGLLAIGTLGEWVVLALVALVAIGLVSLVVWGGMAVYMWTWRQVALTRVEIDQRRQNMAIQAAQARTQLMIDEKRSRLVYASEGFLPVAFDGVMDATNSDKLLELAARRIETLRLPENVPSHLHYVVNSDTEQTLNNGANVPTVTGNLGDLDFLLPGSQSGKFRLIGDGDTDEQ